MNIKDRLKTGKKTKPQQEKEKNSKKYENIADIFADGKYVKNLLRDYIKHSKNIIFVVNSTFDNEIISHYFVSVMEGEENKQSLNNNINIISEPSISEAVKIFENIISYNQIYIFGLKLNSTDNMLNKLRTIIAVNFPNLTQNNIDVLIGSSNSVFVNFSKNEDGLFIVSKIEELQCSEEGITLEKIFDIDSSYVLTEDKSSASERKENMQQQEAQPQEQPLIVVNNTKPNKVNKYKLLKEKLKRKKENISI